MGVEIGPVIELQQTDEDFRDYAATDGAEVESVGDHFGLAQDVEPQRGTGSEVGAET